MSPPAQQDPIVKALDDAGVPPFVHGLTLLSEGYDTLRGNVKAGRVGNLIVYPQGKAHVKARKAFYLYAKELFLSGICVHCVSLYNLGMALKGDHPNLLENIRGAEHLFVADFFNKGVAPSEAAGARAVAAYLLKRFERELKISVFADTSPQTWHAWWPASLVAALEENATVLSVSVN